MGMFDDLRCEYPLPDGYEGTVFQTKDTPTQFLEKYTIRKDGVLVHHSVRYESVPRAERPYPDAPEGSLESMIGSCRSVPVGDVILEFHGVLRFYDGTREYEALYDRGKLLKIEVAQ